MQEKIYFELYTGPSSYRGTLVFKLFPDSGPPSPAARFRFLCSGQDPVPCPSSLDPASDDDSYLLAPISRVYKGLAVKGGLPAGPSANEQAWAAAPPSPAAQPWPKRPADDSLDDAERLAPPPGPLESLGSAVPSASSSACTLLHAPDAPPPLAPPPDFCFDFDIEALSLSSAAAAAAGAPSGGNSSSGSSGSSGGSGSSGKSHDSATSPKYFSPLSQSPGPAYALAPQLQQPPAAASPLCLGTAAPAAPPRSNRSSSSSSGSSILKECLSARSSPPTSSTPPSAASTSFPVSAAATPLGGGGLARRRLHDRRGLLSWTHNGDEFLITLRPISALDGRYTVIGEVLEGMDVLEGLEREAMTVEGRPLMDINVGECGLWMSNN